MKVSSTRRIAEKIMGMMDIRQAASMVNALITNSINSNSIIPSDIDVLRKEALKLQKSNMDLSVDHIMMMLLVEAMIAPYFVNQTDIMNFFMNWLLKESRVFNIEDFNQNPYMKNIDFSNQEIGDFELRYHDSMPYELEIYNIPKVISEFGIYIPRIGCFAEQFYYPVIFQKSIRSTWMSVSPNEVYTMEKPIRNAVGKVLTLGCGMGYFAYMASLKEDVESVTIVELEQSVIDLFEKFILPQFEHKEKVTLIKMDAIEYLGQLADGDFDYCFADIWIGVADIEPYLAVKHAGKKFRKMKLEYWIEESFAMLLSADVYIEIMKGFSEANNIPIPKMDNVLIDEDGIRRGRYIQKLFENIEIAKPEHIDYYMKPQTILGLIGKSDIIY